MDISISNNEINLPSLSMIHRRQIITNETKKDRKSISNLNLYTRTAQHNRALCSTANQDYNEETRKTIRVKM